MAVELGNFISELLERLPNDHPDRTFLERENKRVRKHLPPEEVIAMDETMDEVAGARRKVQKLVDSDIERHGLLSVGILRDHIEKRKAGNDHCGAEFVGNLLPSNCRQFTHIVNILGRNHIVTKSNLIGLSDVKRLRGIRHLRGEFILAMRDLAIAEKSQIAQRQ